MQYLSFAVWLISLSTFKNYFPCMAESLSCSLETITTLVMGGSPIQNKKLKNNNNKQPKPKQKQTYFLALLQLLKHVTSICQWNTDNSDTAHLQPPPCKIFHFLSSTGWVQRMQWKKPGSLNACVEETLSAPLLLTYCS